MKLKIKCRKINKTYIWFFEKMIKIIKPSKDTDQGKRQYTVYQSQMLEKRCYD